MTIPPWVCSSSWSSGLWPIAIFFSWIFLRSLRSTWRPALDWGHVDRKLRRKIQEKKIAMGHKPDDHEEEQTQGGMVMGGM